MDTTDYMSRETFTWDGGRWHARTSAMSADDMARELRRGRFGPIDAELARELSTGGTFDVTGGEPRTFTVVHVDGQSRAYQRVGDAPTVRPDFPGR